MDVLVVGAGGGGGSTRAGGGGAGGFRSFSSLNVCGNSPYTATINGGGAGGTTPSRTGTAGGLSKIVIDCTTYQSDGGGRSGRGDPREPVVEVLDQETLLQDHLLKEMMEVLHNLQVLLFMELVVEVEQVLQAELVMQILMLELVELELQVILQVLV